MADDQNPQDPQFPASPSDQSANSDTNRPDSFTPHEVVGTIMADPSQSATTDDRPISTILADPTTTLADSTNPPSNSPSVPIEPVSTISADSTTPSPPDQSASTDNQLVPPVPIPEVTSSPISPTLPPSPTIDSSVDSHPDLSNPSDLGNPSPISVGPPDNDGLQVQSDVPNNTSTITQSQQATESAEIKPEPSEVPQNAPLADSNSTSTSFGDLLGSDNPSPPIPSPPSPDLSSLSTPSDLPVSSSPSSTTDNSQPTTSASTSFGDLIKDIKPEESVIQPPPIPSEPTVSSTPTPPPITTSPVPISSSLPLPSSPISSSSFSDASSRRQKAILVRKQKHDANIAKILDFLTKKGKVKNIDVRDYLRISQSTVSDYLHSLVASGKIKKEGKGKATVYTL